MKFTTPQTIDQNVTSFCQEVVPDAVPVYVPVSPGAVAIPLFWIVNVAIQVIQQGGRVRYGWAILWSEDMIQAGFHAVWQSPGGLLLDVTPQVNGEQSILFLPDPARLYQRRFVPIVRKALTANGRKAMACLEAAEKSGITFTNWMMGRMPLFANASFQVRRKQRRKQRKAERKARNRSLRSRREKR